MQKRTKEARERATWAAVLALLGSTAMTGCGYCPPSEPVPEDDPCFGKEACDTVEIPVEASDGDGGVADGGTTTVFCGCCNG